MTERKQQSRSVSSPSSVISDRLVKLEAKLEFMQERMDVGMKSIHECVDRVANKVDDMTTKNDSIMHGDSARPGMFVRVDRLEQSSERHRWLTRRIIGAVVTLAVGAIAAAWAALS